MPVFAIAAIAILALASIAAGVVIWVKTLRDINVDVSDWDRHAFDDLYE